MARGGPGQVACEGGVVEGAATSAAGFPCVVVGKELAAGPGCAGPEIAHIDLAASVERRYPVGRTNVVSIDHVAYGARTVHLRTP